MVGPALAVAALIAQMKGDVDSAIGLTREWFEVSGELLATSWVKAEYLSVFIRACAAGRQLSLGHELIAGVAPAGTRGRNLVLTATAALPEPEGKFAEALDLYREAAKGWQEYGCLLERGYALAGAARCLLQLTRSDEAVRLLGEAKGIFEELGAQPLIDETMALLAAAHDR